MKLVTILFGAGWWVPWHLFIVGSIVPMFFLLRSLRRQKPGAGPQGEESLFIALVSIAFSLTVATVVDGALLGWKIGEWYGAAWGTIIALAFFTLWTVVVFAIAKRLSVPKDDEEVTILPASMVFAMWHAGIVVANLTALNRIHG